MEDLRLEIRTEAQWNGDQALTLPRPPPGEDSLSIARAARIPAVPAATWRYLKSWTARFVESIAKWSKFSEGFPSS